MLRASAPSTVPQYVPILSRIPLHGPSVFDLQPSAGATWVANRSSTCRLYAGTSWFALLVHQQRSGHARVNDAEGLFDSLKASNRRRCVRGERS